MTGPEFDKFYADRLLGILVRAFAEMLKVAKRLAERKEPMLIDDAELGSCVTHHLRLGMALAAEIRKELIPDPIKPEPPKPQPNGQVAQPQTKKV